MIEIYKQIDSRYSVSNLGNVKNHTTGRVLKQRIGNKGYFLVSLYSKSKQVHRLVANVWIDNSNNKETVNHKDGNKLNNNINNLEWVSRVENIEHARINNLVAKGESVSTNILTEKQVLSIRNEYVPRKVSMQKLANKYGVSKATIVHIITRRNWKHI